MAVTFKNMGRMGNFLFQAATAFAYAKSHNLEFIVPNRTNDKYWNPLYLKHLAKPLPAKPNIIIKEQGHAFQELPFDESWRDKNIILEGYWQSEKYFKEYRQEILELFDAPKVNQYGCASIHIRLGDYKMYPDKHPVVTKEFYQTAIRMLHDKYDISRFKVFSDEPGKAMGIIISLNPLPVLFEFISGNNEETDLKMIAECEHNVNSSSTFSWWGAWLNPNKDKMIITPKDWFVPGHGGLDTSDIIPSTWIKI